MSPNVWPGLQKSNLRSNSSDQKFFRFLHFRTLCDLKSLKKIGKKILGFFFLCFEPSEKLKSQYRNNETLFEKCALIITSGYVSTLILYLADPVIFCLFWVIENLSKKRRAMPLPTQFQHVIISMCLSQPYITSLS